MTFATAMQRRDAATMRRFGIDAVYEPIAGGARGVKLIFEDAKRVSATGTRAVKAAAPVAFVLKADFPELRRGDIFTIGQKRYRAKPPDGDEGEMTRVKLEVLKS